MSTSMNEEALIEQIKAGFGVEGEVRRERRVWINIAPEQIVSFCEYAKSIGFVHLSAVSVTDLLEQEQFELTYHLWSYQDNILVTARVRINRNEAVIDSIGSVWVGANVHEREMHEMFGVHFAGNPDLSELYLEDWSGPPPFRKDFDTREYVRETYLDKNDAKEKSYWGASNDGA